MNQFLRIIHADSTGQVRTTSQIRNEFNQGKAVELAGYKINAKLYHSINELMIERLLDNSKLDTIEWIEVNALGGDELNFASQKLVKKFNDKDLQLNTYVLAGEPYWATTEIAFVDKLIRLTTLTISNW